MFDGSRKQSKPGKAMRHHGHPGIDAEVVDAIAILILNNS